KIREADGVKEFPTRGSGSVSSRSGEFTSPGGGIKPPLHQTDPLRHSAAPNSSVTDSQPSKELFQMNRGFLRTGAPLGSDLTLVVEIGMGLALLAGMVLARRRRYRAHAWCQSTVVLLNQAAVAVTMAPSFRLACALPIRAVVGPPHDAVHAPQAAAGAGS